MSEPVKSPDPGHQTVQVSFTIEPEPAPPVQPTPPPQPGGVFVSFTVATP